MTGCIMVCSTMMGPLPRTIPFTNPVRNLMVRLDHTYGEMRRLDELVNLSPDVAFIQLNSFKYNEWQTVQAENLPEI